MKNFLKKIFTNIAIALGIYLVALFINAPVAADENSQVINSLTPREPNFFQQGITQFERETQLLIKLSQTNQEPVLKLVPDKLPIQEQLSPLEKPQALPSEPNKTGTE
ncbi:hypothetical protein [Anabaena subtropica]|uniref:Uncharacterized protein n=1 Tax=Anabaena subtropica FACHB-260 TaxID=2692884 RepID=A0ABR8CW68_9NOST|nr:hypothetical protein [Anabaena subtropica]MBD2347254.1 hypothetical protein [Anabaena subtropica FACHB-260]